MRCTPVLGASCPIQEGTSPALEARAAGGPRAARGALERGARARKRPLPAVLAAGRRRRVAGVQGRRGRRDEAGHARAQAGERVEELVASRGVVVVAQALRRGWWMQDSGSCIGLAGALRRLNQWPVGLCFKRCDAIRHCLQQVALVVSTFRATSGPVPDTCQSKTVTLLSDSHLCDKANTRPVEHPSYCAHTRQCAPLASLKPGMVNATHHAL